MSDKPSSMTARERTALGKIVDQRFRALQNELDTRREQIEQDTRDRLIAESHDNCRLAVERMQPLVERAEQLVRDIRAEVVAIGHELRVEPGSVSTYKEWADEKRGRTRQRIKTHKHEPVGITVRNEWAPINIEATIAAELRKLLNERAQGGRSLEAVRLELQERLLLGEVQSDTARAFLEEIPSVDTLLPMPEQPQIEETNRR